MRDKMKEKIIEIIQAAVGGCARHWALLIAQALLNCGAVLPPCKVGDSLYYVLEDGEIIMDIAEAIYINQYSDTCLELKIPSHIQGMMCKTISFDLIGKTVFLTKEQAERAAKGGVQK